MPKTEEAHMPLSCMASTIAKIRLKSVANKTKI